jgi:hypothetical protein
MLWLEQTERQADDERRAPDREAITHVEPGRPHADQHFVGRDGRLRDVRHLEVVKRTVLAVDNRPHVQARSL